MGKVIRLLRRLDDALGNNWSEALKAVWEGLGIFGPILTAAAVVLGIYAFAYVTDRRFRRRLPKMIADGREDFLVEPQLYAQAKLSPLRRVFTKAEPLEVRLGPESITLVGQSGSSSCVWSDTLAWNRHGEANWTLTTAEGEFEIHLAKERGWDDVRRRRIDCRIAYHLRDVTEQD